MPKRQWQRPRACPLCLKVTKRPVCCTDTLPFKTLALRAEVNLNTFYGRRRRGFSLSEALNPETWERREK